MILKTLMIPSDAAGMTLEKLIRILMPDLSESFFHRLFSVETLREVVLHVFCESHLLPDSAGAGCIPFPRR